MVKLFHKRSIEEKIERQAKKREKYYQKQWIQWIEPKLIRVEGMNIKTIKKYQDKYFRSEPWKREQLVEWAHWSNVRLPPLEPLKSPLPLPKKV